MELGTFSKENKINRKRRIGLAVLLLFVFFIQNTSGLFLRPWGVPAMLLPSLVICMGMFEREIWGMIYGLAAGALLDAFSAETVCYHSVMLLCAGYFSGLLITKLMRNNLRSCFIMSAVFLFIYNTLFYILFYYSSGEELSGYTYVNTYLISVIYSSFFIPVFYFIIRGIEKKNKSE